MNAPEPRWPDPGRPERRTDGLGPLLRGALIWGSFAAFVVAFWAVVWAVTR